MATKGYNIGYSILIILSGLQLNINPFFIQPIKHIRVCKKLPFESLSDGVKKVYVKRFGLNGLYYILSVLRPSIFRIKDGKKRVYTGNHFIRSHFKISPHAQSLRWIKEANPRDSLLSLWLSPSIRLDLKHD